jgi:hypothetical protein
VTGAVNTENIYFTLGERLLAKEAVARVIALVRQFVRGEGNDPYFFSSLFGFISATPFVQDEMVRDMEYVAVLRMLAALGYVENESGIDPFLNGAYDQDAVLKVSHARSAIIRTINEGIAASGL